MARTLSAGLITHVATATHTRAHMVRLDLVDGTSIGITDHDIDIAFNLGDGSITYSASTGVLASDIVLKAGFDADNCELQGPIGSTVTRAAILGGRYNRARVRIFEVNWNSLADGAIKLLQGSIAQANVISGKFSFQVRSDVDYLNQTIGRLITPYCKHDLGDANCQFALVAVVGTVTAVTDAMRFTVSFTGSYANDYFNLGTVEATSGTLAGTQPVEIFDWTSGGAKTLFTPLAEAPAIADTFDMKRGCGKTRTICRDTFSNVVNFGGFPEVPGSDQVLKYPIPSA